MLRLMKGSITHKHNDGAHPLELLDPINCFLLVKRDYSLQDDFAQ